MKVKISSEWFRKNVIRNETGKIREERELWYKILEDHNFIGEFQFEVRVKESNELVGIRVGFFDKRFYKNKLYMTVDPGNYKFIEE